MVIKRRFKPFLYIIAFILALAFSVFPSNSVTASAASGSTTVYITDYGEKYHTYSCQYLRDSCHAISLSNAVKRGYSPCSVCNPPRLTSGGGSGSTTPSTPSTPSYQGGSSNNVDDERWIGLFWAAVFLVILIWLIVKWIKEEREWKRQAKEEQEENEEDELD